MTDQTKTARRFPRHTMSLREAMDSKLLGVTTDGRGEPTVATVPADETEATHYYQVRRGDPVQLCRLAD